MHVPRRLFVLVSVATAAVCALPAAALADGNVTAAVDRKGALVVKGDAAANDVQFRTGAADDAVLVIPRNGTTLNGAADAVEFPKPASLRIDGGAGNDVIEFGDDDHRADVLCAIRITPGTGDDRVRVSRALFDGPFTVQFGAGGNVDVTVRHAELLRGGITIDAAKTAKLNVYAFDCVLADGSVTVSGSRSGADTVELRSCELEKGGITWTAGRGDTSLLVASPEAAKRLVASLGSAGTHRVSTDGGYFEGGASVRGSGGDDTFTLNGTDFGGPVLLDTGSGGFQSVTVLDAELLGKLDVRSASRSEARIRLESLRTTDAARPDVSVRAGRGALVLEMPYVRTRGGFAVATTGPLNLSADNCFFERAADVRSTSRTANDSVSFLGCTIDGRILVDLGGGTSDTASFFRLTASDRVRVQTKAVLGRLTVSDSVVYGSTFGWYGGSGTDVVLVEESRFDGGAAFHLSGGDDAMQVDGSTFTGGFLANGGKGADRLCDGYYGKNAYPASRSVSLIEEDHRVDDPASASKGCGANTVRASVGTSGAESPQGGYLDRTNRVIEQDGEQVVFISTSDGLVPGDANGGADVFVRHLNPPGTTEAVSVTSAGAFATADYRGDPPVSSSAGISTDGRFVVFVSTARDLVAGDVNDRADVFLRDRLLGTTEAMSDPVLHVFGDDTEYAFPGGADATISGDGSTIAFVSRANYDLSGDTWYFPYDRVLIRGRTGGYNVATVMADGSRDLPYVSYQDTGRPWLDDHGYFCAFHSSIPLVPGNSVPERMVYVRNLRDDATTKVELISTDSAGSAVPGWEPVISDDGTWVAFVTSAKLAEGDVNAHDDIYARHRTTGETRWISAPPEGGYDLAGLGLGQRFGHLAISGDGRFYAFSGPGRAETPEGATVFVRDVFLHDLNTATTAEFGFGRAGLADGESRMPGLSREGRWFVWMSSGVNLVEGDTNSASDVFVQDRGAGAVGEPPAKRRGRAPRAAPPRRRR